MSVSVDKAWLLGLVAGDGHLQSDNGYRLFINCGPDKALADYAASIVRSIYDVPASTLIGNQLEQWGRKQYFYTYCSRKLVVEDLAAHARFGVHRWALPQLVMDAAPEVRAAWFQGLADAEGSAIFAKDRGSRYVSISSTNGSGLTQASELLTSLGIRHVRPAPRDNSAKGHSDEHKILICYHADLKRYAELIGFRGVEKAATLKEAVESYERFPIRKEEVEAHLEEVRVLRETGQSWNEIAAVVGLSRENVRALCKRHAIECITPCRGRMDRMLPTIEVMRQVGLSAAQIAVQLGLKNATAVNNIVLRAKRRHGLQVAPARRISDLVPQMKDLRSQGLSCEAVAERLGLTKRQVYDALARVATKDRIGAPPPLPLP